MSHEMRSLLDEVRDSTESPLLSLRERFHCDDPVLGLMGYHVPRELLSAAGIAGIYCEPDSGPADAADEAIQTFVCAQTRNILARALRGDYGDCSGFLLGHGCDSVKSLASILRFRFPNLFIDYFRFPTNADSPSARSFLKAECIRLLDSFSSLGLGPVSDESLFKAFGAFSAMNSTVMAIRDLVLSGGSSCSFSDLVSVYRLAMIYPPDLVTELLTSVRKELSRSVALPGGGSLALPNNIPVAVVGTRLPIWLAELIDQAGLRVVEEDLYWGIRSFGQATATSQEQSPLDMIVQSLLEHNHEPHNLDFGRTRLRDLVQRFKKANASGVIYCVYKFCDPLAFEYPYLRDHLLEQGVPVFLLEIDTDASVGQEQLRNRLMAFAEQLGT